MSESERLIPTNATVHMEGVTDRLYVFMLNIENALLLTNAVPGKDYTYDTLIKSACELIGKLPEETIVTMPFE